MIIDHLSLVNFKNILQGEISFSPKINCFIGKNGSGKTNVLDAIYFLSYCKSHHNVIDSQNITHGQDFFVIQGDYLFENGQTESIYCGLKRNKKKIFKRNKKEYERFSQHIGLIPLVLISPNDQKLISEGSEERRKFIDSIIAQYNNQYLQFLIFYNNTLQQRNALLKINSKDFSLLKILDVQLVEYGLYIHQERTKFLDNFEPIFQKFYSILSPKDEVAMLAYSSQLNSKDFKSGLEESVQKDLILGHTSVGIHKDDLEMNLGEYPIKRVGSQGQNKTFLIALKLAQFQFIQANSQKMPLLLLDDIFDKLDSDRVKKIIQLVSENGFGQIFITDTNREHIDNIVKEFNQESFLFWVENGTIEKI